MSSPVSHHWEPQLEGTPHAASAPGAEHRSVGLAALRSVLPTAMGQGRSIPWQPSLGCVVGRRTMPGWREAATTPSPLGESSTTGLPVPGPYCPATPNPGGSRGFRSCVLVAGWGLNVPQVLQLLLQLLCEFLEGRALAWLQLPAALHQGIDGGRAALRGVHAVPLLQQLRHLLQGLPGWRNQLATPFPAAQGAVGCPCPVSASGV